MGALYRKLWPPLSLMLSCALFGSAMVATKSILGQVPLAQVALWRFAVATALLLPFTRAPAARLRRQDLGLLGIAALLAIPATYLLQFAGLALTTATNTALITGLTPTLLAVAAVLFEHEVLSRLGWLAVALSTVGAMLLVGGPGSGGNLLGNGLVLLSLLATTAGVLLSKRLLRHYPPLATTAYLFSVGTLLLIPISLVWSGLPQINLPPATWLWLAVQGVVFTALPYVLWNLGLSRVAAAHAGVYANVEPAAGALLGVALLKESLNPLALLGGLLIVGAAVTISLAPPAHGGDHVS